MRSFLASAALFLASTIVSDVSAYYTFSDTDNDDITYYRVTTTVTNRAPVGGTCQSPTWVGIHDGSFDIYDSNKAASPALERLAEDGTVGPLMEDFGAHSGTFVDGVVNTNPLCPGGSASLSTVVPVKTGMEYYFSYASMVLPSNDAFVANGNPKTHQIFNTHGKFVAASILETGSDVMDAGTEVNDESATSTAFFFGQISPDTGVDEDGLVQSHTGFLARGYEGILDSAQFSNADFTAPNYEMMMIEVKAVKLVVRRGQIAVTNPAPHGGTCLSPTWVGIHDGSFNIYHNGYRASPGLERLAEDGSTGPLSEEFIESGEGAVWEGVVNSGPLCPGESTTVPFEIKLEPGTPLYFSYAAMVLPSNDAFLATGNPRENVVVDSYGNLNNVLVVDFGSSVLDAGTEVNDELPQNTAFFGQTIPDSGTDEYGVVGPHPGFMPGSGGILDTAEFVNADFTQHAYKMLEISVVPDDESRGVVPKPGSDDEELLFYRVTATVVNLAPMGGTCQSPTWIGIHEGTFDIYDKKDPASPELERLAEDGNVNPLMEAFAAKHGTVVDGVVSRCALCPGQSGEVSTIVTVKKGKKLYFSYASMVLPSNDAFIANGNPKEHQIFNKDGEFTPVSILELGRDVMDAGTEVNDESRFSTAYFGQMFPNSGQDENGAVHTHPGYSPPGTGGILDSYQFGGADFKAPGYEMMSIDVTATQIYPRTAKIVVTNPAPEKGTCLSPTWVGIHDGSFSIYKKNSRASPGLARLAEDGNTRFISREFSNACEGGDGAAWQNVLNTSPLCPSEYNFMTFEAFVEKGKALYFSYASKILPSNDAFVANRKGRKNPVFNEDTDLVDVLVQESGLGVLDAGTEVNDEVPEHTAFFGQTEPGAGVDQDGVVTTHPGFKRPGKGGILDSPDFENADFTAPFQVLEIVVMDIPEKRLEGGSSNTPEDGGENDDGGDGGDNDGDNEGGENVRRRKR